MRIALFTDAYLPNINGVSFSVEVFSQILAESGNQVEIYAPAYKGGGGVERKGKVVVRRFYSFPIPTYKDTHLAIPDLPGVYSSVEEFSPDVIHIQTPGSLGLTGILVGKMLKKPIVGTYHTLISEVLVYASLRKSLNRYLSAIERVVGGIGIDLNLLSKEAERTDKPESIPQRITWSVVNRVYKYCDVVICPSGAIKRELTKRGVNRPIEVISNGVDVDEFWPKKNNVFYKTILCVGRLGFEKNVDIVVKAFAEASPEIPEVKMIIAGDGPARVELEGLVMRLKIEKKVKFLGMVDRKKLPEVYRKADVFVTASTMETQGMVVLEAMSCGLPTIGVRKYALPDVIKDGINGYVVKPGSVQGMAKMMVRICRDEKLREKLSRGAVDMAKGHDVREMARKLSGVYQDAILRKI